MRKTDRMLFNAKEGVQCIGTTLRSDGYWLLCWHSAGRRGDHRHSAITYMTEKTLSGNSDSFGKGDIRGVAAPGG